MSVTNVANIVINLDGVQPSSGGFGTAVAFHTFTAPQLVLLGSTTYFALTPDTYEATLDGYGVGPSDTLYQAIRESFAQDRKASQIYVVVCASADFVAQVTTLTFGGATDGDYTITVVGHKTASETFAASSNTATEIRDGIDTLILANADFLDVATPADVSTDGMSLTAPTEGAPFTVILESPGDTLVQTTGTESEGYVDLAIAFDLLGLSYYFILETGRSTAANWPLAQWAQTKEKIFFALDTAANAQDPAVTDDIGSIATAATQARTAPVGAPTVAEFPDFALVGKMAPRDPGSATWHQQRLVNITGFVPTDVATMRTKNYTWVERYVAVTGSPSASVDGKVASGNFIDSIRGRDALAQDLRDTFWYGTANADKIDFTEEGIDIAEAWLREVILRWDRKGLVDATTLVVTRVAVDDLSSSERGTRIYSHLSWTVRAKGAIHSFDPLTGTINF